MPVSCTLATCRSRCWKMSKLISTSGSLSSRHNPASEFITEFSTSPFPRLCVSVQDVCWNQLLLLSPPLGDFLHRSQQISCVSLVSPGQQPAFRRHVQVQRFLVWKSNAFGLTTATRTAGVRRPRLVQIFDDSFRLPHTCCFDATRCICVCRVVSCSLQCVLDQTSAVRRDELRKHGNLQCNRIFRGPFCGCRHFMFLCCHCRTLWSESESVRRHVVVGWSALAQADLVTHRLGSAPRAFRARSVAVYCHIVALLELVSEIAQRMSLSRPWHYANLFLLTPTNTPLDHLDSSLCLVRLRKSTHSPKLGISTLQGLPFKTHVGSVTVVRFTWVEE